MICPIMSKVISWPAEDKGSSFSDLVEIECEQKASW